MRNNKFLIMSLFIFAVLISACGNGSKSDHAGKDEIIPVKSQTLSTSLFFSGTIQPLKTVVVTSPAEGVIDDMHFHFGDAVKPNQKLFVISSEKFKADYKSALM